MNLNEAFVKGFIENLMVNSMEDYKTMLSNKVDPKTEEVIIRYVKISIFNDLAKFFGVLDGISFLNGIGGKKIVLTIDGVEIQGDLHDIFSEQMEEYLIELQAKGI